MSGTQIEITLIKDDEGVDRYAIEAWPVSRPEAWSTEWDFEDQAGMSKDELRRLAIAEAAEAGYKPPFSVRWKRVK